MSMAYRYATIDEKDRILDLVRVHYGTAKTEALQKQWAWRYENHAHSNHEFYPFFICEKDGHLIGSFSFFPAFIRIQHRYIQGKNPIDLLVHPKHRGTGIRLIKKILENEPMMLGVANPRTEKLWKRLFPHYGDICRLFLFSFPINTGAIVRKKTKIRIAGCLPSLKSYYRMIRKKNTAFKFQRISSFEPDYDLFLESAAGDYVNLPVRNSAYLNWRFRDCPIHRYDMFLATDSTSIRGHAILRTYQGNDGLLRTRIIEIFARKQDESTYQFMVDEALLQAIARQADIFQAVISPNDPALISALRRFKGFLGSSKQISNIIGKYDSCVGDEFTKEINWHLSYGDFDLDLL